MIPFGATPHRLGRCQVRQPGAEGVDEQAVLGGGRMRSRPPNPSAPPVAANLPVVAGDAEQSLPASLYRQGQW